MHNKKPGGAGSEDAGKRALEERVDAMMDPKRVDDVVAVRRVTKPKPAVRPPAAVPPQGPYRPEQGRRLDQPGAPTVPKALLRQLPHDKASARHRASRTLDELSDELSGLDPSKSLGQLEDEATDKAVDDIVAKEGDIALAVADASVARRNRPQPGGWKAKLRALIRNKWTWVGVAALLVVIFAVPLTRYQVLGLVVKRPVVLTIIDSKTMAPVSNARVELAGATGQTDGAGQAKFSAPVGQGTLVITKQYYQPTETSYFVGFKPAKAAPVKVVATGRLVPITIVNKVTGEALKGAEVRVLKTTAKTDVRGRTDVALPARNAKESVKVTLTGYNPLETKLQVTDQAVKANSFELTPAGRLYFLSNQRDTIDVVRTNLDGSGRHTVLEGTGREEKASTSLLASRDWRYLVLKARRDGAQAGLYLIDTTKDEVTAFETGAANFDLIGWYGHTFVYNMTRDGVPNWQTSRQMIKSYDAANQQPNQLDQTQAEGDAAAYAYQNFANFYLVNGAVVYTTAWTASADDASSALGSKNNTIRAVQTSGSGQSKKDYQSLPATTASYNRAVLYEPGGVYFETYNRTDGKTTYTVYENQTVKPAATAVDQTTFNQIYPTYLVSPSGTQTFWTDLRDGKNSLFVGDANAKNQKQVATVSEYTPYGWYGDNYLLVSRGGSQLSIMSASDANKGKRPPLKITDYYKPAQTYPGYGYGYGGL